MRLVVQPYPPPVGPVASWQIREELCPLEILSLSVSSHSLLLASSCTKNLLPPQPPSSLFLLLPSRTFLTWICLTFLKTRLPRRTQTSPLSFNFPLALRWHSHSVLYPSVISAPSFLLPPPPLLPCSLHHLLHPSNSSPLSSLPPLCCPSPY